MSFWDRFRKKAPPAPSPSEDAAARGVALAAPPAPMPKELERLLRVGLPGGPTDDEAVAAFGALRATPDEGRAVEELARSAQMRKLPDALLLALGATLLDRGEPEGATRVLSAATCSPALVLLADLAERRGELPVALSFVERVLLRDLDHPGARERHRRWRAELGFDLQHKPI
ncbi:MAG: hypothetical protein KIS78_37530, partial [Labilithrix sp.]|nr:hypothetical protein [Labilithrix sp.]